MSYNFNFIAIEGDHRDSVVEWCQSAGYVVETDSNTEKAIRISSQFINGRTVIHDGSVFDEQFLADLSETTGSRIFQLSCGGTAESYCFECHNDGQLIRAFVITEGELVENSGTPLAEEDGLVFDNTTSEGEMLTLGSRFGFDSNQDNLPSDYFLTFPHQQIQDTSDNHWPGRILSTLICVLLAVCFFVIIPRSPGLSWLVEFLMLYGLAASLYILLIHECLYLLIPERWNHIINGGFIFQLPFAVIFGIVLFFTK